MELFILHFKGLLVQIAIKSCKKYCEEEKHFFLFSVMGGQFFVVKGNEFRILFISILPNVYLFVYALATYKCIICRK